jgi:hypothetical protein
MICKKWIHSQLCIIDTLFQSSKQTCLQRSLVKKGKTEIRKRVVARKSYNFENNSVSDLGATICLPVNEKELPVLR